MQFWNVTPHVNRNKTYLFNERCLLIGTSMFLTHQTLATSNKSQKFFCVKWHKFIQRSQSQLFRLEYPIFLWSYHLAEHLELFEIRNLITQW